MSRPTLLPSPDVAPSKPLARSPLGGSWPAPVLTAGRTRDVASAVNPPTQSRRLTAAFEAIESFPALLESQLRLLAALEEDRGDASALIGPIEADLGLGLGVLRAANRRGPALAASASTVAAAVAALPRPALHVLAERTDVVDLFDRPGPWGRLVEGHRRHAAAVQSAIHRIAVLLEPEQLDLDVELLCTAALLHDVGKLVLAHAHPAYPELLQRAGTPEALLADERSEFGVDHAVVGGVLLRRWGLPQDLVRLVERHHADEMDRKLATLRLADLVAHHGHGDDVSPRVLTRVARRAAIDGPALRTLLYDQGVAAARRPRSASPCPLSRREMDVLRRLATGQIYKQIADDLGISASTVRTHLHNVYRKLGAADRAQAVLIGVDRGWLSR